MKYIIRANDLGYSEGINYGIYKSASDGMIRNIGLMANMPAAEHGIQLLQRLEKEYGRKICLGLHVNISNGRPLSDPVEIPGLTETDGSFHNSRYYRNSGQDLVLQEEVIKEVEAQLQHFIKLTGRYPDYMDNHAVFSDSLAAAIKKVADRYGIICTASGKDTNSVFPAGNTRMRYCALKSSLPDYDPMESLRESVEIGKQDDPDVVHIFVLHPGYLDQYILNTSSLTVNRTKEVEMACAAETKQWLYENGITCCTFSDFYGTDSEKIRK